MKTKGSALTILLTGGGTGGHITPLLAVARELKRINRDCRIIYVGEHNGKFASMLDDNTDIDRQYYIFAGKFRRYHGESWLKRITDIKTLLLNLRDVVFLGIGIIQSLFLIGKLKPSVVFLKGGFVGVPIGLACAAWRRHFITHDSDAVPGLANRIVGRWATLHATAMDPSFYSYPSSKVRQVGVIVGSNYTLVDHEKQRQFKKELGIPLRAKMLFVTGGSGGAQVINKEIADHIEDELANNADLYVVHQVGIGKQGIYDNSETQSGRLKIYELMKDMYKYSAAADVIVTRAGANTIAEFGVQAKPCIVVPNPLLTGGHQLKNAQYLKSKDAAVIVNEKSLGVQQGSVLWDEVRSLFANETRAREISSNLHNITLHDASARIANILIDASE